MRRVIVSIIDFADKHSSAVIIATICVTIFFTIFLPRLRFNADLNQLIPKEAEAQKLYEKYSWGGADTERFYIAVEDPKVLTLEKLQYLYEKIQKIEGFDEIEDSINPFNMIVFLKEGRRLKIDTLTESKAPPKTAEELEDFKDIITTNPLCENTVISPDHTALTTIFTLDLQEDYTELFHRVDNVVKEMEEEFEHVYLAGSVVINNTAKDLLIRDMPKLLVIAIVVIVFMYYIGFRAKRSILLPLLVVCIGTLWTLGFMGLMGFPVTYMSIITPPLVITLGSSYSIHLLNQYFSERKGDSDGSRITHALYHINKTIIMAALTTAASFLSFLFSSIPYTQEFGIATSLGIIFCAILSLFFFPAVLTRLRQPTEEQRKRILKGPVTRFMIVLGRLVFPLRYVVPFFLALVFVVCIFTLRNLTYGAEYASLFKAKERTIEDNTAFGEKFGGFTFIRLNLEAPEEDENYFLNSQVLKNVGDFEDLMRKNPYVLTVQSFPSYLQMLNDIMTDDNSIPERRPLILLLSRYLRALEDTTYGREMTGQLFNEDFTRLTLTFRIHDKARNALIGDEGIRTFIDTLREEADSYFSKSITPQVWGISVVTISVLDMLKRDQFVSITISFIVIFFITAFAFRSFKYGLLSLIPLAVGIALNFIFMALLNIELNAINITFSSVVIGIGVDDSIHLLLQFRRQRSIHSGDSRKIITETLIHTGRPILLTSVSVIAGLLVLVFSSFTPVMDFGLLVASALFTTTLSALIILPSILILVERPSVSNVKG